MDTPTNSAPVSAPAPSSQPKSWLPDWQTMAKEAFEGYKQNAVSYVLMMLLNVVVAGGPLLLVLLAFAITAMLVNKSELGIVVVVLGLVGFVAVFWAAIV